MKKYVTISIFITFLLLVSCGKHITTDSITNSTYNEPKGDYVSTNDGTVSVSNRRESSATSGDSPDEISTSEELFSFLMSECEKGDTSSLYKYFSDEMKEIVPVESINTLFLAPESIFGSMNGFNNSKKGSYLSYTLYTATVLYDNAEAAIELYLDGTTIVGFNYNISFTKNFSRKITDTITEEYFLLKSGDYLLDAVYTHNDSESVPAFLLIPGSGPSDYNETVGFLSPFEDIAHKLAERGFSSLRIEKRTCRNPESLTPQSTIADEYLTDFITAYEWLNSVPSVDSIYLLGHSLGAQIALSIAEKCPVDGIAILNGTARHLADVLSSQFVKSDSVNEEQYNQIADQIKGITDNSSNGTYYYGASDFYWASYNNLYRETVLNSLDIPIIIINSTMDEQLSADDITSFKELSEKKNVETVILDNINHYGYSGSTFEEADYYQPHSYSDSVIDYIVSLIKNRTN